MDHGGADDVDDAALALDRVDRVHRYERHVEHQAAEHGDQESGLLVADDHQRHAGLHAGALRLVDPGVDLVVQCLPAQRLPGIGYGGEHLAVTGVDETALVEVETHG